MILIKDLTKTYKSKNAEFVPLWIRSALLYPTRFTAITGTGVGGIRIMSFDPKMVLMAIAATMLLGVASTVIPMILLNRIKPMNIIKAKE